MRLTNIIVIILLVTIASCQCDDTYTITGRLYDGYADTPVKHKKMYFRMRSNIGREGISFEDVITDAEGYFSFSYDCVKRPSLIRVQISGTTQRASLSRILGRTYTLLPGNRSINQSDPPMYYSQKAEVDVHLRPKTNYAPTDTLFIYYASSDNNDIYIPPDTITNHTNGFYKTILVGGHFGSPDPDVFNTTLDASYRIGVNGSVAKIDNFVVVGAPKRSALIIDY